MPFLKHGMAGGTVPHGVSDKWIKDRIKSAAPDVKKTSGSDLRDAKARFGRGGVLSGGGAVEGKAAARHFKDNPKASSFGHEDMTPAEKKQYQKRMTALEASGKVYSSIQDEQDRRSAMGNPKGRPRY